MSHAPSPHAFGPGFYGKLPSRGDFVTFGLTGSFLDCWDDWLGAGLEDMRARIGRRWEALMDACPAWRFALPAGLAGRYPIVGVMIPSRDKVARRFPFVIACPVFGGWAETTAMPVACREWFDDAEAVAHRLVERAAEPVFARKVVDTLGSPGLPQGDRLAAGRVTVRDIIGEIPAGSSLWWTRGGGRVDPSMMVAPEMPSRELFGALLDGDWSAHGWLDLCAPPRAVVTAAAVATAAGTASRDFPSLGGFSGLTPLSA